MSRLQKKCALATAGLHLLLLLILVVGPAFVPTKEPAAESFEVIEYTPLKTTDLPFSGGGSPTGSPVPPAPAPASPAPKAEVKPEPAPPPVREVKPTPQPTERPRSEEPDVADTKPKKQLPSVSTEIVTRSSADKARVQKEAAAAAQVQQRADAQRRSAQVGEAVRSLREGLSGSTTVELLGPGGGGIPYANFKQAVASAYYNAWTPPAGIANESAVTKASVTIDRDGTVISARIIVPSGDAAMDASVQRTLERVKFVAPLPEGSTESQRTLPIIFDLKAKKGIG